MARATLLAVLMLFVAAMTASAEPRTVRIGEVKIRGNLKFCHVDKAKIAGSLKARLSKLKVIQVVGPKSHSPADYIINTELLCSRSGIEFNVSVVEVSTAAIVWSKSQTLDEIGQMDSAVKKMYTLLSAYFRVGKMPDQAESTLGEKSPLYDHTVTLFPLHSNVKGFTDKQLLAHTRYLRIRLKDAVKCDVMAVAEVRSNIPKGEKCTDKKCHFTIAETMGTDRALAVSIVRKGKHCALAYTLYDVDKKSVEKAASIFMKCSNPALKEALDKLVQQISGD